MQIIGDALAKPELYLTPQNALPGDVIIEFVTFHKMCLMVLDKIKMINPIEIDYKKLNTYWAVVPEDRYEFREARPKIELRSLSEDWKRLEQIIHEKAKPKSTDLELVGRFIKAIFNAHD